MNVTELVSERQRDTPTNREDHRLRNSTVTEDAYDDAQDDTNIPQMSAADQASAEQCSKEIDPDKICHICSNEYGTGAIREPVCTLECGHSFGLHFIHKWVIVSGRTNGCPICRKVLLPPTRRSVQNANDPTAAQDVERSLEHVVRGMDDMMESLNEVMEQAAALSLLQNEGT